MSRIAPAFDNAQRTRLAQFANALISGSPGWPSASEADVHGKWIDITLAARPDLVPVLMEVLAVDGDAASTLQTIQHDRPVLFDMFSTAIAGTYLMNPRVRRQLGLPAGQPESNPPLLGEAEFYLEDGLLEPVRARGSAMFRRTPSLA
jgi:hypothetical protein